MNLMDTRKTAILVDGGYYRKRAVDLWGSGKSPEERAEELFSYCFLHITAPSEPRDLYRIFYYDCPGMTRELIHPATGEKKAFSEMDGTKWTDDFFSALSKKRKLALRKGELAEAQAHYILKPKHLEELISGKLQVSDLSESHFKLNVKQKGVDMRIGLDVASLAYGKHVSQIILIAGDSDFIPVAKMARRNGIDFILDPMKQRIKDSLSEHVDGIETFVDRMYLQ